MATNEAAFNPHLANAAMYRMEHNRYLGDSIAVVCEVSPEDIANNGLTGNIIATYIKTACDTAAVPSLQSLGSAELFDKERPLPLRIASSCELGVFGDMHCDCEDDRQASLRAISKNGQGVFVQLPQEALGHGLIYKARELELQVHGVLPDGTYVGPKDIFEAAAALGVSSSFDQRGFRIVGKLFDTLGINRYDYTLITGNSEKAQAMAEVTGLAIVGHMALASTITIDNIGVYLAKIQYGTPLAAADLGKVLEVLRSGATLPRRTIALIEKFGETVRGDLGARHAEQLQAVVAAYDSASYSD